jgi:hypothetical protein
MDTMADRKPWIQITPAFEYEVIDVYLCIPSNKRIIRLEGFDAPDWLSAKWFAEEVAEALGIEYVGERGEAGHEVDWKLYD